MTGLTEEDVTPGHYAIMMAENVRALIRKEMLEAFVDPTSGVGYDVLARWVFTAAWGSPEFKRAVVQVMREKLASTY